MRSLYIHWPFCRKKCPYCDFNSHVRERVDHDAWKDALIREMRSMATMVGNQPLGSIFFGGGTPSLMPPYLVAALIDAAQSLWSFGPDIEITLEANPTSSEAASFRAYRDAGVGRLSLGVQALDDAALAFLGREHSAAEALSVVEMAAALFPRYSFDLIYARPHQTPRRWEEELRRALPYSRGHLSLYQLTVEPDTPFARTYAKGGFALPDADTSAALYEITRTCCDEAGMTAYEISNYAAPGQESRHNLNYWQGGEYIGVGPGAHGRLRSGSGEWFATSTIKSPERWIAAVTESGHGLEQKEWLDNDMRAEEILLGGLRLREGIAFEAVSSVINPVKLGLLKSQGFVTFHKENLAVTSSGRLVTERIIQELMT